MVRDNLTLANTFNNSSIFIDCEFATLSGMASGYLDAGHSIVRIYLYPAFVRFKGPTISVICLRKGSVITGTLTKGALG